jgi:hypothetical protein
MPLSVSILSQDFGLSFNRLLIVPHATNFMARPYNHLSRASLAVATGSITSLFLSLPMVSASQLHTTA